MPGTLYLVATPIGNLGDFSPRAVETLQNADFIAAEDTRVSVKLLNHFDIKKPLVSYHEHNRAAAGQAILTRLLSGETCALVTDAGMPAISDPGEELVRLCAENDVPVFFLRRYEGEYLVGYAALQPVVGRQTDVQRKRSLNPALPAPQIRYHLKLTVGKTAFRDKPFPQRGRIIVPHHHALPALRRTLSMSASVMPYSPYVFSIFLMYAALFDTSM